jgi:hypothetical protein
MLMSTDDLPETFRPFAGGGISNPCRINAATANCLSLLLVMTATMPRKVDLGANGTCWSIRQWPAPGSSPDLV